MKRTTPACPKRVCICLDISNADSLQQSQSQHVNELNPESSSSKMQTPEKRNTFIRLGSKRKTLRLEQKENNISETPKNLKMELLTPIQPQRRGSLTKYFQSSKRILTNSTQANLNTNDLSNSCLLSGKNTNLSSNKRTKTETCQKKTASKEEQASVLRKSQLLDRNLFNSQYSNQSNTNERKNTRGYSRSRQNSCSLNKKMRNVDERMIKKVQKIKEYKFVEEYLSDLEIEGILNELEITKVPQVRWPLIVVDKIYQLIRKKEFNEPHTQIIRKF